MTLSSLNTVHRNIKKKNFSSVPSLPSVSVVQFDSNVNVTTTGSNLVTSWKDKTGTYSAIQTNTSYMPSLTSSYINGKYGIVQNGTGGMLLTASGLPAATTSATYFFVMKFSSFSASINQFLSTNGNWRLGAMHLFARPSGSIENCLYSVNGNGAVGTILPTNSPFILMINYSTSGPTTTYARLNGVNSSTHTFSTSPYGNALLSTELDIGGWAADGGRSINGGYSEFLYYNSPLTDAQISQIELYLSVKWGITVSTTVTAAPSAPTAVTATVASSTSISVAFTPPSGTVTSYTVTSSPGSITASGSGSPITVTGLTAGTAYTFTVTATNVTGTSPASSASASVTTSAASSVTRTGMTFELVFGTSSLPTLDTFGSTLTNTGPPSMVNDATRGYVLYCNVNQYVTTTVNTGSSSFSKAWWYKPNVAGNYANTLSSGNLPIFYYTNPSSITAQFNFSSGTAIALTDTTSRGTGTWTHYVVCYDNSTSFAGMYVNGTLVSSGTTSFTETSAMQINAWNSNPSIGNAYFDNIHIYNRALTATEISSMYTYELNNPTL